ncbi:MAG TPA: sugar ABC transporter ATP-binding protein, partial [Candidatus Saccharimonadales bacterium]|nr:sugar ABC transporter ATP-binding protein [Candidatus Saccharimonadales bacterium]
MSAPLLAMRNISKSFGGVKALDEVQLTLRPGEIHALMGENGAGKSTLIKVLTGVYSADAGVIELNGSAIHPGSPRDAESCGISTVYQEINLIPTLSIADNILLGRQPVRFGLLQKRAMRKRAEEALARLGLSLDVTRPLSSCSLAIQQMVAIARALDIKAKLLVLDEPTSSLDEREVEFLFGILRRLRQEGMALLFVTHFLDQVYAVSDYITVLRNGKFVGEYRASELPRLKLISAMLGRNFEEMQHLREETATAHPEAKAPFLAAHGIGREGLMKPLDLSIAPGEVVGLAGLLGSGRTETAKMLFGILPPSTGKVEISGQLANLSNPRRAIQHGLAFCSEDRKTEGIAPH